MKKSILILACSVVAAGLANGQVKLPDLKTPPANLTIFAEGVISTALNERDFAISPDGTEIYYTISTPRSTYQTIVFTKKDSKGTWSKPEVAPFAGTYVDLEPVFSHDGNTLYFSSNRPTSSTEKKDFDIWRVKRQGAGWGTPENLGPAINTDSDEFYPSISKSGNIYWTAMYPEGPGREDIYVSVLKDNQFQPRAALDTAVNSKAFEFNAFVDPNEQYILFTSYGRKDDSGGGDLYMSVKDVNGKWKPAKNLKEYNSRQLDYCPFVSPDGSALFITSERHQLPTRFDTSRATVQKIREILTGTLNSTGNIYWIDFKKVLSGF